jgi:hypothetical protein
MCAMIAFVPHGAAEQPLDYFEQILPAPFEQSQAVLDLFWRQWLPVMQEPGADLITILCKFELIVDDEHLK